MNTCDASQRQLESCLDRVRQFIRLFVPSKLIPEKTLSRVFQGYQEVLGGYAQDGQEILNQCIESFDKDMGMVSSTDIPFYSMCEHHFMPFWGTVDISYRSSFALVGLSKLPRLVECFSRRLQLQERLGREIAETLISNEALRPQWVKVTIRAQHLCVCMRGARSNANTTTEVSLTQKHQEA